MAVNQAHEKLAKKFRVLIEARREKNKICYRIADKAVVQTFKILQKEV